MIISIIGILFGIILTSLWIFIPWKKINPEIRIAKSVYIRSILIGLTLCSICIIIPEIIWDSVTGIHADSVDTLWKALATSFLRAALIEEFAKFIFVKRVLKKHMPADKLQYMLLAGTIGMGYCIIEKVMLSPGAVIFSAVFSFHIMYQFIMGRYLYEASKAESPSLKRSMTIKAYLIPFLVHGSWDTMMFIVEDLIDSTSMWVAAIGMLLILVLMIGGIIFEVKVMQYIKKLLSGERLTSAA